jgi:transposase
LKKQEEQLKKELRHLRTQRFSCSDDAKKALVAIEKKYHFHQITNSNINAIERHARAGRPGVGTEKIVSAYQVEATFEIMQSKIDSEIEHSSCFILATNIPEKELSAANVINEYKGQDHVEKCFAFMKAPSFFAASFFVKSIKRIQAMLVVMTLALLIYTVAQRRLRKWLMDNKKTIPNQIKKPVTRPTLRWAFMCLEGIYRSYASK